MNRRSFLTQSTLISAGAVLSNREIAQAAAAKPAAQPNMPTPASVRKGDMLYRTLGRTGEQVSLVGLGGAHIGGQKDEAESIAIMRAAIDRGITFFDNCWDYNDGQSEIRMGKALQGGYRDKVYLMTKLDGRTKAGAARQIDESLQRLQTDRIDLMQIHEIIRLEDADRCFAEGGAIEALREAKQAGKIRHIGFTGHKDPFVHNRMLDTAANFGEFGLHMDAVQMPINVLDAHFRSFTKDVLPRLVRDQIGVLAMKTFFGDGRMLNQITQNNIATPIQLLHYSMSLPVSVVITGIDNMARLDQAIEAARTFQPMTNAQMSALLLKTGMLAFGGKLEKFKTTDRFDGTAHNPQWMA